MFNVYQAIAKDGSLCQNRAGDLIHIEAVVYDDEFPIKAIVFIDADGKEYRQEFKLNGAAYGDGMEDDEDLVNIIPVTTRAV